MRFEQNMNVLDSSLRTLGLVQLFLPPSLCQVGQARLSDSKLSWTNLKGVKIFPMYNHNALSYILSFVIIVLFFSLICCEIFIMFLLF